MWVTSSLTTALSPARVALGNFDGVHLGHQGVIAEILHDAPQRDLSLSQVRAEGLECEPSPRLSGDRTYATVVSFNPHPQEFFTGRARSLLTPVPEKVEQLRSLGVEQLVLLPFTAELARLTPEAFVAEVLQRHLQTQRVSVGENFHFGRNRSGNSASLRQIGQAYHMEACIAGLQYLEGHRISSSTIRQALASGDVTQANCLLGRPYQLQGTVELGQQLGRTLGFPTANLALPADKFLPRWGVYSVWAQLEDGCKWPAVMNLGCRPTVAGDRPTVEVHLLDWQGDLYHHSLTVHLMTYLRPERQFSSLDALKAQIHQDCQTARSHLQSRP
ncbi:bifunctional riboflavin kinase/FAD synthetase [Phormidium yuhuli AB48]|uniref:Riboflavin biosynthesis protein n=1 Tax=Phormidium yuhuli AB48 TaxID=2940671 RepID=A0ABY5ANN2_9CYAN|nr:bifunctional riboflavin kinase/FAD synthetase [Phormidium yuhuli]USR89966.1 bifunctional riboflavin kinase/FAD synthetase [Phormidium yuhuli AB48]